MRLTSKFLESVGGKLIAPGTNGLRSSASKPIWNFGYIPYEMRTNEQQELTFQAIREMPRFHIEGNQRLTTDDKKVCLYDWWKHPLVVQANGWEFPGIHQFSGSCVGAGGGTALMTLAAVDAALRREAEEPALGFWLLPYGRSRLYAGMRNPGEGSSGSTFAKAAREDGWVKATRDDLPPFQNGDMLEWGSRVEISWSDGDAKQTMDLLTESRLHICHTVAQCRDHNDVREAIRNGYPCTAASMYAHNGGKVQGSPAVLLASRQGSWSHQMSIEAWWEHPQFGELFYLMNQWGKGAHGRNPGDEPPGGVWIKAADMDWICRDEVFAFSGYQGFPARELTSWDPGA